MKRSEVKELLVWPELNTPVPVVGVPKGRRRAKQPAWQKQAWQAPAPGGTCTKWGDFVLGLLMGVMLGAGLMWLFLSFLPGFIRLNVPAGLFLISVACFLAGFKL